MGDGNQRGHCLVGAGEGIELGVEGAAVEVDVGGGDHNNDTLVVEAGDCFPPSDGCPGVTDRMLEQDGVVVGEAHDTVVDGEVLAGGVGEGAMGGPTQFLESRDELGVGFGWGEHNDGHNS